MEKTAATFTLAELREELGRFAERIEDVVQQQRQRIIDEVAAATKTASVHSSEPTQQLGSASSDRVAEALRVSDVQRASEVPLNQSQYRPSLAALNESNVDLAEHRWLTRRGSVQTQMVRKVSDGDIPLLPEPEEMVSPGGSRVVRHAADSPSRLVELVRGKAFQVVSLILVLVNAAWIGIKTDYTAAHWKEEVPLVFHVGDACFWLALVIEIALQLCAYGWRFFTMEGWAVNVLDTIVAVAQVLELVTNDLAGNPTLIRLFLACRLNRILRVVRVLPKVHMLRALLVSISHAFSNLGWTLLLLLLITYAVGIYLTQLVTDLKVYKVGEERDREELEGFFGSMMFAMLTLYQMISDGLHWKEPADPLIRICGPWFAILICLYTAFMVLALTNVVTGVFVDSSIRTAEEDRQTALMRQFGRLFCGMAGEITWKDFEAKLDTPEMESYLNSINLDREDGRELFRLLDVEESGRIPVDDLVNGCLRLVGPAKAVDLAAFVAEHRRTARLADLHQDFVESSLVALLPKEAPGTSSQPAALYRLRSRSRTWTGEPRASVAEPEEDEEELFDPWKPFKLWGRRRRVAQEGDSNSKGIARYLYQQVLPN